MDDQTNQVGAGSGEAERAQGSGAVVLGRGGRMSRQRKTAMSRVISPVTGKPYGLAVVCRVWRLPRSGVYRHLSASPPMAAQRRGPLGAMSDEALTIAIRGVLSASPF